MSQKPQAACALIFKGNQVLGVSRKDDHTAFGLPGGKVEEGETLEEALVRELYEETGLTALSWTPLLSYDGADDFDVHTFLVESTTGTLRTSEEGVVKWVSIRDLLEGPFGVYNLRVFKRVLALFTSDP